MPPRSVRPPSGCPSVSSPFPFLLPRVSAPRSAHVLPAASFKDPARDLRRRREAGQSVPVESLGLPRRAVPRPVLIADDKDGNDGAVAAQLVVGGQNVVGFPVGADRELEGARE